MAPSTLILASTSATRQKLLRDAGLTFSARPADVDETELQAQWAKASAENLAMELAKAKALSLAATYPQSTIIGADQTLAFQGQTRHKAKSLAEAKDQLWSMRGQPHHLHAAVACVQGGSVRFSHISSATLIFQEFSKSFLNDYCERMGERLLHTLGGYEYEGLGVQLFEKVEGDVHTILGLPLLPLLAFLRKAAIISS